MRTTISLLLGLLCLCWTTLASAQDSSTERDASMVAGIAASPFALLSTSTLPQRGMLLRHAKGAVRNVVNNGLVLVKVGTEDNNSRLYIKFGSDGMPQLRWRTRFGAL